VTDRCEICGRFVSWEHGDARSFMVTPDTHFTVETYEVLHESCLRREERRERAYKAACARLEASK